VTGEDVQSSRQEGSLSSSEYDPFLRGAFPVGVRTVDAFDSARNRLFPCDIWYPAGAKHAGQDVAPETQDVFNVPPHGIKRSQMAVRDTEARLGRYPLVLFSHSSGAGRRSATFLCTHLASHGYIVAALDHSEVVVSVLGRKESESDQQRAARWEKVIASRVPDVRFLLDHLLRSGAWDSEARLEETQIGIVGHSFGGWTALAAPDFDSRIRAVVALAPGGASNPKPGILPVTLAFDWNRDLPTLYLVAENDASLPLAGMYELFERTPATKRMVILRRADHLHFMDNVEALHEGFRTMPLSAELAAIQKEMRPITELCSGDESHLFVRGLTLCHLDASLKRRPQAQRFLAGDIAGELAKRNIAAFVHIA
jgi:dienelactone hydrolase